MGQVGVRFFPDWTLISASVYSMKQEARQWNKTPFLQGVLPKPCQFKLAWFKTPKQWRSTS